MAKSKKRSHVQPAVSSSQNKMMNWIIPVLVVVLALAAGVAWMFTPSTPVPVATTVSTLPAEISVAEAYQQYKDGVFVLDVRTQAEWAEFHAPNTTSIPLDQLEARSNELPKDREIVVICRSGNRSKQGREVLLKAGFTQVTSVSGGLTAWKNAGYPVE